MSIVEKAIAKAQVTSTKPAPSDGVPTRAAQPRRETVTPISPLRPAGGITLDVHRLRREGLLAPEQFAQRTTDEFRRIKWPVLENAFGRSGAAVPGGNVVAVTSSVPGEGKTFSAVNLAFALALERDCSVLLVDGDIARPRLSRTFGVESRPGLFDALESQDADWRNFTLATDIPGLAVLPAGRRARHAPELLASKRMEAIVAEAAQLTGQIVIIDCAPLLATNEAQVLARLVGQLLLVVRANHTRQTVLGEALAMLDRSKPIGLILNDAEPLFGGYYYDYNYQSEPAA